MIVAWVVKGAVTYLTSGANPYRTAKTLPPTIVVAESLDEALSTYKAKASRSAFASGSDIKVRVDSVVPWEEQMALMVADSRLEQLR